MTYLEKILSRDALSQALQLVRERGQSVVQCHGCFDILHPGHLRHLTWARRQADVLVVTVSADSVVQKGRNRPYVPERLRAESLAALEVVSFVCIDDGDWAGPALTFVRPDVYVKGKEFEQVFDGRFGRERRLVEEYGGRVLFSSGDVVYSSTHIIDSHKHELEPVAEQVAAFCGRHAITEQSVRELLDALAKKTVAVVGETIVDTYVYAEALGMSAEAPVLVVRPRDSETFIGGAAIVAQHLSGLGAKPHLLSLVGRDEAADRVRNDLVERGIVAELLEDPGRPTIVKTRYISEGKKLLNVNVFSDHDLDQATEQALLSRLQALGDRIDAVVVTDFGYGVVTDRVIDWARELKRRRGVAVVGDVQCSTQLGNVRRMRGLSVIAPSEREARLSLCDRASGIADLGAELLLQAETDCVLVTLGARGMMLLELGEGVERETLKDKNLAEVKSALSIEYLPSMVATPVDPMGAGDAMLATLAASLAADASPALAAFVAMGAAAVAASQLGNVAVTRAELLAVLFPASRAV